MTRTLLLLALTALVSVPARAQYALPRSVVSAGGTSFVTAGSFRLGSTVGEPAAHAYTGAPTYGGGAGFWYGLTLGDPPPPTLPPLVLVPDTPGPYLPGEDVVLTAFAGDATTPVANLFGVSFRATWDPALFAFVSWAAPDLSQPGGFADCDGDGAQDLILFDTAAPGFAGVAASHRGDVCPTGFSGAVAVGRLTLRVDPGVSPQTTTVAVTTPSANDLSGTPIALDPRTTDLDLFAGLFVYPGDTDGNGASVSTADLAPIAAWFGESGPARDPAQQGIDWFRKLAPSWMNATPAFDLAHTDANGDGSITEADALAVGLNYGRAAPPSLRTRPEAGTVAAKGATLATLTLAPRDAGETVEVVLDLTATPADSALGLTTLWHVPAPLAVESVEAGAWLDDGRLLALDVWAAPLLDAGLFRRRGASVLDGTGEAVVIRLAVTEAMTAPAEIAVTQARYGTTQGATPSIPADRLVLSESIVTAGENGPDATFGLAVPAPNPARAAVRLAYTLPEAGTAVRLTVHDALGREVAVLADGPRSAGRHDAMLDASRLAPGVYVVRLTSGAETATRRLTVVR